MADKEGLRVAKNYHTEIPFANQGSFHIKGSNNLDWGMKKHLSNIFDPKSGNTVMFAFDHGYFMGSTAGLERLDLIVPKLFDNVDVLMSTRGALRTCISPDCKKAIALRTTSGSSMIDDDLSHEIIAVDIEDAIRMNADCMAIQTFIGADGQLSSIDNLSKTINAGLRYSIPTMGVIAVGKDMDRTDRFFKLATRIVAEMGANIIKTYYCDNFEEVVAACPVPIVVAGGKKLPENEALELAYKSISGGARGLDMGRNIFQSENPVEMCAAIAKIVHEGFTDKKAWEFFQDAINK
ncbi:MAG: 3-hydroxy-5-phosphonooxypentane-2,4-dione thiolase [Clostridia bacterium]|nr:3-hydroxy-5-phosphonooxypentane-2,4-dione thiolase [Clostridia bacterium]